MAGSTPLCVFCDRARVTEEHLIPKWMLKILKQEFNWHGGKSWVKIGSGEPMEWSITRPSKTVARCVCARCNNTWMSAIEDKAKPALTSMIRGKSVELNDQTQIAIGTWMCLKALLGAYINLIAPIPEEWPRHFYAQHLPPPDNWMVYTTRYVGSPGLLIDALRIGTRTAETVDAPFAAATDQGVLASFIIGQLAIQVRGIRAPTKLHDRVNLLRIWPPSPLVLLWPPTQRLMNGAWTNSAAWAFDCRRLSTK
jgi:hypothetical protein